MPGDVKRKDPDAWAELSFAKLCRWLLLSLDRLEANEVRMTHELISNMLGVCREGITEAAC
jgi:hypothetical protein